MACYASGLRATRPERPLKAGRVPCGEELAGEGRGLTHEARGLWHAFRRDWATARKDLSLVDVAAVVNRPGFSGGSAS